MLDLARYDSEKIAPHYGLDVPGGRRLARMKRPRRPRRPHPRRSLTPDDFPDVAPLVWCEALWAGATRNPCKPLAERVTRPSPRSTLATNAVDVGDGPPRASRALLRRDVPLQWRVVLGSRSPVPPGGAAHRARRPQEPWGTDGAAAGRRHGAAQGRRYADARDLPLAAQSVQLPGLRRGGGARPADRGNDVHAPGAADGDAWRPGYAAERCLHLHRCGARGAQARARRLGQRARSHRRAGAALLLALPMGRIAGQGGRAPLGLLPGSVLRRGRYRQGPGPAPGRGTGGSALGRGARDRREPGLGGGVRSEPPRHVRLRVVGRAEFSACSTGKAKRCSPYGDRIACGWLGARSRGSWRNDGVETLSLARMLRQRRGLVARTRPVMAMSLSASRMASHRREDASFLR